MRELRLALFAADPGLRRLGAAVRAAVSFALVAVVLLLAFGLLSVPLELALPGLLVAAVASVTTGMGLRLRLRFLPLLLLAPASAIGLALGVLVLPSAVLTGVVFGLLGLALVASTLLGRPGTVTALGAVVGFVAVAIVRPTWADLLWCGAAVLVAAGLSAVILGVALRERPRLEARRMLASLRALAEQAPLAVASGEGASRRHLDAFAAAVSATRARIAADPDGWPERLRRGDGVALADLELRFERAVADAAGGQTSPDLGALVLDPLLSDPDALPGRAATSTLDAPHAPVALDWRRVGRSLLSVGVQLGVAVVAATTAGLLLAPALWHWAVLAALVTMFGVTSASASLTRGWRRLFGALIGIPVGLGLALLVDASVVATAVAVLVLVFLQQYVAELAYGVSILVLTVLLFVLVQQSPEPVGDTLLLRLLLTGVGGLIGAAVGFVVLPSRAGESLRRHADDALSEVATTLAAMGAGERAEVVTLAGRDAYGRFVALRSEAQASRRGWPLSRHHRILSEQLGAGAVVARELRASVHDYRARVVDKPGFRAAVADLEAKVASVRAEVSGGRARREAPAVPDGTTSPEHGLLRLERAIDALAVALRAG